MILLFIQNTNVKQREVCVKIMFSLACLCTINSVTVSPRFDRRYELACKRSEEGLGEIGPLPMTRNAGGDKCENIARIASFQATEEIETIYTNRRILPPVFKN